MKLFNLKPDYSRHPWKWWHLPFLIILIAGTVFVVINNRHKSNNWHSIEGNIFGTIYHITYNSSSDLNDSVLSVLNDVDKSLSVFNDSSTITQINNNTSEVMDLMLTEVINTSKKVNEETSGAFDITVAPLVNAWGFGFKNQENVDSAKIDSILQFVGMDKIRINGSELSKTDQRVMLDCSAIAKGYGVDMVARMFINNEVKDFMVEIGGEVRTKGTNDKGRKWRIGINEPEDDTAPSSQDLQNVLEITDMSIATSGNYRNFYIKDNKKYAHTIDPNTGYPVQHSILSSTVVAEDCMIADAYATAFMVLGLEKSKALLQKHKELKAYFIYSNNDGANSVWHSDGLVLDKEF